MARRSRFQGTLRAISANWPLFAGLYGGIVLALLVIGVSAQRGWLSFIPLATAVGLLLTYFLAARLWLLHRLYDREGVRPHHALFDLGGIAEDNTFVYLDLGERYRALGLGRRLTDGEIIVVDLYNPQWTPDTAVARQRTQMPSHPPDPRFSWLEGTINLIPLPDSSVSTVIACQTISQFSQEGDQQRLLREIWRILTPNGRLLLAESVRTQTYWLVLAAGALRLPTAARWRQKLQQAGFVIRREQGLHGVVHCFRADKPVAAEARQLALQLAFEQAEQPRRR